MKIKIVTFVLLFSVPIFAMRLMDIERAKQISYDLTTKCKELRKTNNLKETGIELSREAKKYEHLQFLWSNSGSASLEYKGVRGMIMHSDCMAPGEQPVDSI